MPHPGHRQSSRKCRWLSRTVFSALSGMRLLACLIVAPQRGYDEPAILSYAISSFCPTSADGLHGIRIGGGGLGLGGIIFAGLPGSDTGGGRRLCSSSASSL